MDNPDGTKGRSKKTPRKEKGDEGEPVGTGAEKVKLSMKMGPGLEGRKAAHKVRGLVGVSSCLCSSSLGTLGTSLTTSGIQLSICKKTGLKWIFPFYV